MKQAKINLKLKNQRLDNGIKEPLSMTFIYDQPLDEVKYAYFYDDYELVSSGTLEQGMIIPQDYVSKGIFVVFSKEDINLRGTVIMLV